MYTEDEAKELWCPNVPINRMGVHPQYEHNTRCLRSRCMAWRWVQTDFDPEKHQTDTEAEIVGGKLKVKTHGYCGLAGKP